MSLRVQLCRFAVIVAAVLVSASCAHSSNKDSSVQVVEESQSNQPPEYEAQLAESISRDLGAAGGRPERSSSKVIFKKPYYYKEYFVYPKGEDDFVVDYTERESRTVPLSAEVSIEKFRFATRTHRKREDARLDENFLRDTGSETVSYELRNGKWYRLGSLYVADKTEESVGGEWQSIRERAERPVLEAEEPKGGLRRLFFWR